MKETDNKFLVLLF